MKKELQNILEKLITGTPAEFKELKKRIEKLWNSDTDGFKKAATVMFGYLSKFDQIKTVENQAAFASGLNMFFLSLSDEYFEILKGFTLKVIQYPDGRIREAIRKTASWLHCSLTMRVSPIIWPKAQPLTKRQLTEQEKARKQYISYVSDIEKLIDKYNDGQIVEYIDEMKPSVNKSLQLLWAELTDSPCYREVVASQNPVPLEIQKKREEIKQEFVRRLEQANSDHDFEDIMDIIYEEDGQDDLTKIISLFDNGDISELENVLELATDAWNYFPHKILDGKAPVERF